MMRVFIFTTCMHAQESGKIFYYAKVLLHHWGDQLVIDLQVQAQN